MSKILTVLILFLAYSNTYGQRYKKYQSRIKHSDEIISIVACDDFFATSSYDKSVIVWDYQGKLVYKYKLIEGKINSMSFMPKSNALLLGVTEVKDGSIQRHVIQCLDDAGKLKFELIDTTLNQEFVDRYYNQNTTGVTNAINAVSENFPELKVKKNPGVPQVGNGLSHVELVQSIAVSPDSKTIVSIDKFNNLKIWNGEGKIQNSLQVTNNKKDTELYFLSDSTLFISPNITVNINNLRARVIEGYANYSGIPFGKMIYFRFDYNKESRQEKLYNTQSAAARDMDPKNHYTREGVPAADGLVLLGFNGLIQVIDEEGNLISSCGKDRNEVRTFRGEQIITYSNISKVGVSPDGRYLISGDEQGKVTIWKYE